MHLYYICVRVCLRAKQSTCITHPYPAAAAASAALSTCTQLLSSFCSFPINQSQFSFPVQEEWHPLTAAVHFVHSLPLAPPPVSEAVHVKWLLGQKLSPPPPPPPPLLNGHWPVRFFITQMINSTGHQPHHLMWPPPVNHHQIYFRL